jgi:hypothetical protein
MSSDGFHNSVTKYLGFHNDVGCVNKLSTTISFTRSDGKFVRCGVSKQADGAFVAVYYSSERKEFKTYAGACRWLSKFAKCHFLPDSEPWIVNHQPSQSQQEPRS